VDFQVPLFKGDLGGSFWFGLGCDRLLLPSLGLSLLENAVFTPNLGYCYKTLR
jgi:hypothetical protein